VLNNVGTNRSTISIRIRHIVRTFFALPAFLLVTVIPWLLVLGASLWSNECRERGWTLTAAVLRYGAKTVGVILVGATLWFIIVWSVQIVRSSCGVDDRARQDGGESA